jgi:nicotinamidase/pyrazinamidase
MTMTTGDHDVLVAVDLQNDFCPGGALAVPQGHEVVPVINALARKFAHVVLTQDWHPAGHLSFASSHPGKQPFEFIEVPTRHRRDMRGNTSMISRPVTYSQILWPDHCVQGTRGAAFRDDLSITHAGLIIRKGYHREIDSYSTFYENDRKTPTGLAGYLRERGFRRVFLAGLAFDFCVRYSAEDAHREGFETVVVEDGCRAIDMNGSADETRALFKKLGIRCVNADAITGVSP